MTTELCHRCGGSVKGKDTFNGAHRYFPDCMETIQLQFAAFTATGKVPTWYTGPDPRQSFAALIDTYAGTIDEKAFPDAVAALLRFRSKIVTGEIYE